MAKSRVGRKPAISNEKIFGVIKDLPVLDEKNKLKKERDPVWQMACKKLEYKIQRKNL